MGCWMSTPKRKVSKDATFDGAYVAITPPTRGLSRRMWRSRNSYASSSGVSSGCSTPLRRSAVYNSRSCSPESAIQTPVKQRAASRNDSIYENLPAFLRNVPLDIDGDDENEAKYLNVEARLDESGGYYTEGSSDCSTPLASRLKNTQSDSENLHNSTSSECELDMELRMMGKAFGIMPKTSSPVMARRDMTFDIPTDCDNEPLPQPLPLPAPSASYQKWRKYLQMTPTYALHNVTNIPEAIAGRFCPSTFPGYSEVRALRNELLTSSRHRKSHYQEAAENVAETIIMELPVPTITTEL